MAKREVHGGVVFRLGGEFGRDMGFEGCLEMLVTLLASVEVRDQGWGGKWDLWAHGGGVQRSLVGIGASWWLFRVLVALLA